ncbi:cation:proton antiporter [Sulfurimonas sp.]|jgi:monovalent cation:H+ antiporter-2, CPA2 family|uniref:cation:proton antiporter domain-containing protein n=1 Tax=Sulfurimonas sp. TaxID=2022749 RepID=UPI0025D72CDC|nr:cation:proton antiporter [Sulfurimonas sp.]MBT5934906.1 potassium transporter [Sulfurimonas sp.]
MENVLAYIIATLGISTVINLILKRLGVSQIIGYIFTGIIIVYGFDLRDAGHSHALKMIAEFGIVFLMFTIGLEISLSKMGTMKKEIFANGTMQVGLTTLIIYLIGHYLFSLNSTSSIIMALAFSLSSTAVVLSYLKSSKEIYTPYGQNATGILIFQDIAVIPILIFLGFLTSEANESIYVILGHTLMSAIVVVSLLFVVGKRFVTWLLRFSASSEVDELFMGSVLFIVTGASLFAHSMGFTYSLGAFVAGMIIAETKYHHKVEADIAPFKDILLGTFFIVVGMKIDLSLFVENIGTIIGLFVLVLLLKTALIFSLMRFTSSSSISLKSALSLSQVGEFSFVIFSVALAGNVLDEKLASLLVLIVIFSMIVTPFFITKISKFVDQLMHEKEIAADMSHLSSRKNHVIICGYGVVGKFVTEFLDEFDAPYIVVDNSSKEVQAALENGKEAYLGDTSKASILSALHIEKASSIIVTLDNVDKKRLICEAILKHSVDANVIVKVVSDEERNKLSDLNITIIVDGNLEVARVLVQRMLSCKLRYS